MPERGQIGIGMLIKKPHNRFNYCEVSLFAKRFFFFSIFMKNRLYKLILFCTEVTPKNWTAK